jgi:glycosyltransferase involved in cell wall biosynthesis
LRILILNDFFFPSPGGGYRAITNLVAPLAGVVSFSFLSTPSNDARDGSLPGVSCHDWQDEGDYFVRRIPWRFRSIRQVGQAVKSQNPELIISASLMSTFTPLLLIWRGLRFRSRDTPPILLMPQGELMQGALAIRPRKKAAYLRILRASRATQNVQWWASTDEERIAILQYFPSAIVHQIQIPPPGIDVVQNLMPDLAPGFRILFASSINKKKRPSVLVEALCLALRDFPRPATLTICGSVHDQEEQQRCVALAGRAPACLHIENLGPIAPQEVANQLKACHVLALPTLGENYGYVIIEALANSRPVLCGKETPWTKMLAAGAGEVVEDSVEAWTEALSKWLALNTTELKDRSDQAFQAAFQFFLKNEVSLEAKRLFENLARRKV